MVLGAAVDTVRVSTYSDQILINLFELLKLYKAAETNPNGEGVIQSFELMANSMLGLTEDPKLKGFILGLKGIIVSMM